MEVVVLVGVILTQANKLLENEAVSGAVKAVTGWIGNILGKPSAKEKLEQIEQSKNIEENVNSIKANLEFVLEGNQQLQNELAAKIAELQSMMKKQGLAEIKVPGNNMNITGNNNIGVQGVNVQGGNFTISQNDRKQQ